MRKLAVFLLLPAIALAAVHPGGNAAPAPLAHFAIKPMVVATKPGDPGMIRGEFILRASPQAQAALLTGGGCMIEQFDGAKTCASDADCDVGAGPTAVHGYCADGSGPVGAPQGKTCWYKPALPETQSCKRWRDTPMPTNQPLSTDWMPVGTKRPVSWRLVSCQNVVARGCADLHGVQGVDRIHEFGPPKYFPALPAPAHPGGGG